MPPSHLLLPNPALRVRLSVLVGCQLTAPFPAPGVRVPIVVLIVVFVVTLICLRQPWTVAVGTVLGAAIPAAEIARRLTGHSYRLRPLRA